MKLLFSKISYLLCKSFWLRLGAVLLTALLSLSSYLLIQAALDPYDCRIIDGVAIDGVALGGMTKGEVRKALKDAAGETLLTQPLTITLPEETITLDPRDVKIKLDVRSAVKDAYSLGRSDDGIARFSSGLSSYLTCDQDKILGLLLVYSARHDSGLTQCRYSLEGTVPVLTEDGFDPQASCPTLVLTLGTPEKQLDIAAVQQQILALYHQGISAGKSGNYHLHITCEPSQLPEAVDIDALYEEYATEAINAAPNLETYQVEPAVYGLVFDREAAQAAIDAADYGETIAIPLEYDIPEIFSENALFQDVLGHCETRHTDDENRNTNLRLVCEILDGFVLQPGEEFSYNGVVGERTPERGFKPAGAYSGTRLVKDYGGGVCQGSSTLYNCVLLADLEVTERVCHGLLVNYLPIGMDAAVNWATKTDFKFRNNFHFPIMLKAKLEDGCMKMEILGTDEKDYYIEMRSGRSDTELRIYSNSYKYKYSKETGELISKDLEARSSYMYFS